MQTEQQDFSEHDDPVDLAQIARLEIEDAKARLSDAADRARDEAKHAGATISTLVMDELDRRAADAGQQLRSLASRLRGDVPEQDQPGSSTYMVDQAVNLIEDVSQRLEGQSARQLANTLDRFGRTNPGLFMLGCLLTGAVAGRMIVASADKTNGGAPSGFGPAGEGSRARWDREPRSFSPEYGATAYDEEDPAEDPLETDAGLSDDTWGDRETARTGEARWDGTSGEDGSSSGLTPSTLPEIDRNV